MSDAVAPSPVATGMTGGQPVRARRLPWLERSLEALIGNRVGAGTYKRWVTELGLSGDERVVEIGAGAGACARHLAEQLPQGHLTCVEVDPRWLEIARCRLEEYGARVEFVRADATEWSRPGGFDVAVAHFVLHDLSAEQRRRALGCISRTLVPGGCLCLREPLEHGMSAEELRWQLDAAGFELAGDPTFATVPLMGRTLSGVWVRV